MIPSSRRNGPLLTLLISFGQDAKQISGYPLHSLTEVLLKVITHHQNCSLDGSHPAPTPHHVIKLILDPKHQCCNGLGIEKKRAFFSMKR